MDVRRCAFGRVLGAGCWMGRCESSANIRGLFVVDFASEDDVLIWLSFSLLESRGLVLLGTE